MQTAAVEREFDVPTDRLRSVFDDLSAFFEALGFEVEREGDRFDLAKRVALTEIELAVRLRDDESPVLAYEQIAGPFEAMLTRYVVEPCSAGCTLTIETSYEPPSTGFGAFVNGAAIRRQRRGELDAVESLLESTEASPGPADGGSAVGIGGD